MGASWRGIGPVGDAHSAFGLGLTAVYGLNGTGKSRWLRCLAGQSSEGQGWLHIAPSLVLVQGHGIGRASRRLAALAEAKGSGPEWGLVYEAASHSLWEGLDRVAHERLGAFRHGGPVDLLDPDAPAWPNDQTPGWVIQPAALNHTNARDLITGLHPTFLGMDLELPATRSLDLLMRRLNSVADASDGEQLLDEAIPLLVEAVNEIYSVLLEGAPEIRMRMPKAGLSAAGLAQPTWEGEAFGWRPLAELSFAQGRTAAIAIHIAVARLAAEYDRVNMNAFGERIFGRPLPADDLPPLFLIDEPEAGLHPTAREHLADGLRTLGEQGAGAFVCATHEPAFLARAEALIHFSKELERCHAFDISRRQLLESFDGEEPIQGLRAEDSWLFSSCIALVEGEHDEALINVMIGDALRDLGAVVVKMGGTHRASSAAQPDLLLRATRAQLLVVVDNAAESSVIRNWDRVRELIDGERTSEALDLWEHSRPRSRRAGQRGGRNEEETLHVIGGVALRMGYADRVSFFGFPVRDVQELLPPTSFGLPFEGWGEPRGLWRGDPKGHELSLKQWINRKYPKHAITTQSIKKAALDHQGPIPAPLQELVERVRGLR